MYNIELINRLRLLRTKNIGSLTYRYLLYKWKTSENALNFISLTHDVFTVENAINEIKNTYNAGGDFLLHDDDQYPHMLNTFNASPIMIYKGNINLLKQKLIGIVGTRKPSAHGIQFCSYITKKLLDNKCVIVSGTAIGIDTIAHTESIENTIGILPSGLKNLNINNTELCEKIGKYGLLLTDQPFDIPVSAHQFPNRNRIIAALSDMLLVIEAPENSGSLITANYMLKMQKDIYIMPGRPYDEKTNGSNIFLQENLKLLNVNLLLNIESINFNSMNKLKENINIFFESMYDGQYEQKVYSLLTSTPITISELHALLPINIATLLTTLANLELQNKIVILNYTVYKKLNIK